MGIATPNALQKRGSPTQIQTKNGYIASSDTKTRLFKHSSKAYSVILTYTGEKSIWAHINKMPFSFFDLFQ